MDFPATEKRWDAAVRTLGDFLIHSFGIRTALAVLMTAVSFVLLIACANVAALLLARAAGRRKELAIRVSLEASRLRVVRQLVTEGLVIALLGGGVGLLVTYIGISLVRANLNFNEAISAVPVGLDSKVLLFVLGVSLVSSMLSSLAPTLKASQTDTNAGLKSESRTASGGRSQSRLRAALVGFEIALALFLLIGTSLLIRAVFLVEHQKLGFRTDHLLTAGMTLDHTRYSDASHQLLFVHGLIRSLQQIPGVEDVAVASDLPATNPNTVPIHNAPRVLLVNEEFVRRYFEHQDPLGKQIQPDIKGAVPTWGKIVGVVSNVKSYSDETRVDPEIYEPFLQRPVPSFSLLLRSNVEPSSLIPTLRRAVGKFDAELPLDRVMSMETVIDNQRNGDPLFLRLMGTFALLALILAAIGIYGLIAYSVSQRTHEIGLRIALGAGRSDILWMIVREGLKMAAIGSALGLAMALPLPRLFDALFEGMHFGAPGLYLLVLTAILTVTTFASYVPARRATHVDPNTALRDQ